MEFSEPGIFNYSTLLLSEKRDVLYVGAREAIFELSKKNVTVRNNKVLKYDLRFMTKGETKGEKKAYTGFNSYFPVNNLRFSGQLLNSP